MELKLINNLAFTLIVFWKQSNVSFPQFKTENQSELEGENLKNVNMSKYLKCFCMQINLSNPGQNKDKHQTNTIYCTSTFNK